MTTELRTCEKQLEMASATQDQVRAEAASLETSRLEQVVARVRGDSKSNAEQYLDETVAKFGGE